MTEKDVPQQRAAATKKARTRAKLLAAALVLFDERGWRGTTVEGIAKAAGVSLPTLYNHFQTKEELALEVFRPMLAGLAETAMRDVSASRDPLESVVRHVRDLAQLLRQHPAWLWLLLPIHGAGSDRELLDLTLRPLVGIIEDGQRRGVFVSRREASGSASSMTIGLEVELLRRRHDTTNEIALFVLTQTLPALFYRGTDQYALIERRA
jgi:AcrR family transcriptional regulator